MFYDEQGRLRSLPASWTDVDAPDVVTVTSQGRALLRADDLAVLSALIGEIRLRHKWVRQCVK